MLKTYQVNVDTSSMQTTGGGQGNPQNFVTKTGGNPFQCQVLLGNRHRAVKSIALKNMQMPIGFYNIRAPYNTLVISGVTYTVSPGNYTGTNFINVLNNTITNAVGTFSVNSATNIIQFVSNSGTATITTTSSGPYPSLGTLIGFTNGQSGITINAVNSYIVNFDTYVNVWIENLGQNSLEPTQVTYKIPITVANGSIMHWLENTQHEQVVMVTDNAARVDRLNITVLDRWGNIINNNGLDWSFTLELKSEN